MRTENTLIAFDDNDLVPLLFGAHNNHLSHIEKKLGISITDRGSELTLSGPRESVETGRTVLLNLWERLEKKQDVGVAEIDAALRFLKNGAKGNGAEAQDGQRTMISTKRKTIVARSPNQARYIRALNEYPMVFGNGPAGTGKTYLAVAVAVSQFLDGKVERLVFCRPAVEAGEHLGFLPGDMKEKVDPYLRPIYDALQDMIPSDMLEKKMETGEIEIAPLAFMRGRTLTNAFVILDEAQNTTATQMKMFLTRLGENSRMAITGDLTQIDLPRGVKSGLHDATSILDGVEGISFTHFTAEDVVRHPLVGRIVAAYDRHDSGDA